MPLHVINLVSAWSFGKHSGTLQGIQAQEWPSGPKSSHTTQGLNSSSHYASPLQTQVIPTGWSSSRGNHALCSVAPPLQSSVLPGEPNFCTWALLWPRRFTMMLCAIWERALVCSCSASTACSQIKQALMMSGKYSKLSKQPMMTGEIPPNFCGNPQLCQGSHVCKLGEMTFQTHSGELKRREGVLLEKEAVDSNF